jgi:hypothetical protein
MNSWHTYPKVYALGHAAIGELLLDGVIVEEKIDGSQFSFGKFIGEDGLPFLKCRSHGAEINILAPDNMFKKGVENVQAIFSQLHEGWTYRGEYMMKPKHNTLCYDRAPANNIIIFDINTGEEIYLPYHEKAKEAARLGFETVPLLHDGTVADISQFRSFLDRTSILGGQKIEGVVVKNYARFSRDGKAMIGKFVSEAFKEVHQSDWKDRNPTNKDIIQILAAKYTSKARWDKSIQHLREAGLLEDSPRDIGALIKAVPQDILEECAAEIKDELFKFAWKEIARCVTRGLPEWYKEKLLERQFNVEE